MIMDLLIGALQFIAFSMIITGVTAVFISSILEKEDKE